MVTFKSFLLKAWDMFVVTDSVVVIILNCLLLPITEGVCKSTRQRTVSLRSKRFRMFFRPFQAFFAFWRRENWGERNTDGRHWEGEGRREKRNACLQTP